MWSAAILAGGQATRFGGRDKGALIVNGTSIRARQIAALAQVAVEILIVEAARAAAPEPPPRPEPQQPAQSSGGADVVIRTIVDRVPGCGPLGGLHAALTEACSEAAVVVACDMPFVSAPLLAHLLALTRDADAVVPNTDRGYHPLCAAYTRACIAPIARRLARGDLKMTGVLEDVRVRVVDADEMRTFGNPDVLMANVNTADDYQGLETRQGHRL
jgi:molybdopterin-guanine dinucleotide biosynthesis protein A